MKIKDEHLARVLDFRPEVCQELCRCRAIFASPLWASELVKTIENIKPSIVGVGTAEDTITPGELSGDWICAGRRVSCRDQCPCCSGSFGYGQ